MARAAAATTVVRGKGHTFKMQSQARTSSGTYALFKCSQKGCPSPRRVVKMSAKGN
jgi:hypothetical protein